MILRSRGQKTTVDRLDHADLVLELAFTLPQLHLTPNPMFHGSDSPINSAHAISSVCSVPYWKMI